MTSDTITDYAGCWGDPTLHWLDCSIAPFTNQLGEPVFMLLLSLPLLIGLWIQSRSIYVPGTIAALFGGSLLVGIPAQWAYALYLAIGIAVAIAYYQIPRGR